MQKVYFFQIYNGVIHAFLSMVRNEGFLSLYKGLTPNLIQIIPHTGMQFALFNMATEIYIYSAAQTGMNEQ